MTRTVRECADRAARDRGGGAAAVVARLHRHADELYRHLHADHARPRAAHRLRRHHLVRAGGVCRPRRLCHRLSSTTAWAVALDRTAGRHRADRRRRARCSAMSRCISAGITCRSPPSPGAWRSITASAISSCSARMAASATSRRSRCSAIRSTSRSKLYYIIWMFCGLALLGAANLLKSRQGRAIRALRGGKGMSESLGIDVFWVRLCVFILAAALAGIAGWLYAHMTRFVSPAPFGLNAGIEYLLMAVLGGAGTIAGAVVGAASVALLKNWLQDLLPHLSTNSANLEIVVFGCPVHPAAAQVAQRHRAAGPPISAATACDAAPPAGAATAALPRKRSRRTRRSALLKSRWPHQALRRPCRGRQCLVRREGRHHHRADRSERCGQEHELQSDHRRAAGSPPARCTFAGRDLAGIKPHEVVSLGMARTFQHVKLRPDHDAARKRHARQLPAHACGLPRRRAEDSIAPRRAAVYREAMRELDARRPCRQGLRSRRQSRARAAARARSRARAGRGAAADHAGRAGGRPAQPGEAGAGRSAALACAPTA